ncbi:MAG TPA: NmrA family NAD(P)-binding protein [Gemmatimonadaceae bacterium]|nr:NmrA family NAD(P)-binding protein [Gemmatimonadaceae bacterium]
MSKPSSIIVLAGATGRLGRRITADLLERGANVRAIVRPGSPPDKVDELQKLGATPIAIDYTDSAKLSNACRGADCVVSALAGLRNVIVDAQTMLLNAAIDAKVPRFIPSDYCIDYTKLAPGNNRNLDVRREFQQRLDKAPIAATSILSGMFADLLTGQAPVVLFEKKKVMHWGNADQLMDFTTMDDTARFTAEAALDPVTPRFLRVAGDQVSARGLAAVATEITGEQFKLLRPGGLVAFNVIIKVMRTLMPAKEDLYPPWQGMQYLRDMLSGEAKLEPLDNRRYSHIKWTTVQEVLAEHLKRKQME